MISKSWILTQLQPLEVLFSCGVAPQTVLISAVSAYKNGVFVAARTFAGSKRTFSEVFYFSKNLKTFLDSSTENSAAKWHFLSSKGALSNGYSGHGSAFRRWGFYSLQH